MAWWPVETCLPGFPWHTDPIPGMGCEHRYHRNQSRPGVLSPSLEGGARLGQGSGIQMLETRSWGHAAVIPLHPPATGVGWTLGKLSQAESVHLWSSGGDSGELECALTDIH